MTWAHHYEPFLHEPFLHTDYEPFLHEPFLHANYTCHSCVLRRYVYTPPYRLRVTPSPACRLRATPACYIYVACRSGSYMYIYVAWLVYSLHAGMAHAGVARSLYAGVAHTTTYLRMSHSCMNISCMQTNTSHSCMLRIRMSHSCMQTTYEPHLHAIRMSLRATPAWSRHEPLLHTDYEPLLHATYYEPLLNADYNYYTSHSCMSRILYLMNHSCMQTMSLRDTPA